MLSVAVQKGQALMLTQKLKQNKSGAKLAEIKEQNLLFMVKTAKFSAQTAMATTHVLQGTRSSKTAYKKERW
jgi:hypothetical protein